MKVKDIVVEYPAPFTKVMKLFKEGVVEVQRDHAKRVRKARYVYGSLSGDQLVFHAAKFKGKLLLVDGYTRCEAVGRGLTENPGNVVQIIHTARSKEQLKRLYDQFNNPAAAKKSAYRFDGGLRLTGMLDTVKSRFISRGPRSAVKHAAGLTNIRDSVE